jgi:hypothetical protein
MVISEEAKVSYRLHRTGFNQESHLGPVAQQQAGRRNQNTREAGRFYRALIGVISIFHQASSTGD